MSNPIYCTITMEGCTNNSVGPSPLLRNYKKVAAGRFMDWRTPDSVVIVNVADTDAITVFCNDPNSIVRKLVDERLKTGASGINMILQSCRHQFLSGHATRFVRYYRGDVLVQHTRAAAGPLENWIKEACLGKLEKNTDPVNTAAQIPISPSKVTPHEVKLIDFRDIL